MSLRHLGQYTEPFGAGFTQTTHFAMLFHHFEVKSRLRPGSRWRESQTAIRPEPARKPISGLRGVRARSLMRPELAGGYSELGQFGGVFAELPFQDGDPSAELGQERLAGGRLVGGGLVEVGFELFLLGFQLDEAVEEVVQGFLVEAERHEESRGGI